MLFSDFQNSMKIKCTGTRHTVINPDIITKFETNLQSRPYNKCSRKMFEYSARNLYRQILFHQYCKKRMERMHIMFCWMTGVQNSTRGNYSVLIPPILREAENVLHISVSFSSQWPREVNSELGKKEGKRTQQEKNRVTIQYWLLALREESNHHHSSMTPVHRGTGLSKQEKKVGFALKSSSGCICSSSTYLLLCLFGCTYLSRFNMNNYLLGRRQPRCPLLSGDVHSMSYPEGKNMDVTFYASALSAMLLIWCLQKEET